MAELRPQVDPTHVLRVSVPLDLRERSLDFDALQDVVKLVLALSRASMADVICGTPTLTLDEVDG